MLNILYIDCRDVVGEGVSFDGSRRDLWRWVGLWKKAKIQ